MTDINEYDLFEEAKKTIIVVSGYFDPLGSHHVDLFEDAKSLRSNTLLIVGINSDAACARKKGQPAFMQWDTKARIVGSIRYVDIVKSFDDSDGTACNLLKDVYNEYRLLIEYGHADLIFANGGDRRPDAVPIPEESWAKIHYPKIQFLYGVGGSTKTGASSLLLKQWAERAIAYRMKREE